MTVVGAEELLQASVAVMVNVRVTTQPLVASVCETLTTGVLQVSVAETSALTLASVGRVPGLQPKLLPVGTVTVGAVVSAVQV
jgi:2C-methyl-D-erythritol 2,4-cyclodiphosphate synthase